MIPNANDYQARTIVAKSGLQQVNDIPKVSNAGDVVEEKGNKYQVMFNGVKVPANAYYGEWMTNLIRVCNGHHEPQEEFVFHHIIKQIPENAKMIELGSYWGFYSAWFLKFVKNSQAILIEPDPENLPVALATLDINQLEAKVMLGAIGQLDESLEKISVGASKEFNYTIPTLNVDQIIIDNHLDHVHILHSDIQGAELEMLEGATKALNSYVIDYLFISTHTNELHTSCINFLKNIGYRIIVEHNLEESFSFDGLIVSCSPKIKDDFELPPLIKRVSNEIQTPENDTATSDLIREVSNVSNNDLFYSQHGEDYLLWEFFNHRTDGYFVDIGAFDGIHLSNSYFLEKQGWQGICVEPHPIYFPMCKENRPNSVCLDVACVGDDDQDTITFYSEKSGLYSGIQSNDETEFIEKNYKIGWDQSFDGLEAIEVAASSLNNILRDHFDDTLKIDVLSIDTEGNEFEILQNFDFEKYQPRLLIIEANSQASGDKISEMLGSHGYMMARMIGVNLVYVRSLSDAQKLNKIQLDYKSSVSLHPLGEAFTFEEFQVITEHEQVTLEQQRTQLEAKERVIQELVQYRTTLQDLLETKDKLMQFKDNQLREQGQEIVDKEQVISDKEQVISGKEQVISDKNQELVDKEQVIVAQEQVIFDKEQVIQQLIKYRSTSLYYRISSLFSQSTKLSIIKQWRRLQNARTKPRIGQLFQYPPRDLKFPSYYFKKPTIADNQLPTISIATPSYNQAGFIERTIRSIIDQNYPNLEYIIQDAASDDGTQDILEKYKNRVAHIESAEDEGQANAVNIGLNKSTGDIMAYLNSDDILLPGSLHYIGKFFAQNPDVDVVYGHRILINASDKEVGRWIMPEHENEALKWADYIPQETLFWRRSVWEKLGEFDETFRFALDWDYIVRMQEAGFKLVCLPRFLGAFRVHESQKTIAMGDVGQKEMDRIRTRIHGYAPDNAEVWGKLDNYHKRHLNLHMLYRLGLKKF